MTVLDTIRDLIDSLVIPDRKSAPGNVDRDAILKTLEALVSSDRNVLPELVGLLVEPGQGDDSKARYALHALAVHVGGQRNEAARQTFARALAATLEAKRPADARRFVVRQLQVVGGKEVVEALAKLLADEAVAEDAAQALVAIRSGAAEPLRKGLESARGKARLAIVQALGTLRDRDAARAIEKLAGSSDPDERLLAGWALANIADPASAPVLLKLADGAAGYERTKANAACLLLAERLLATDQKAAAVKVWTHLRERRTDDSERHVRDAAGRALDALK